MAPFWDNFDTRSGSVRYLIDEDFEGLDMSIPGLQRAKDLVRSKYGYNIQPRIFLRVEWNQKFIYPRRRYPDMPSTFQCIVVSDGIDGFILYVYQPGMMLFKKDPTIRRVNNGFSGFINFESIETISYGKYDMDTTSNVGINGIHSITI
ncbi:mucin-4-like [Ciona intestinalis]